MASHLDKLRDLLYRRKDETASSTRTGDLPRSEEAPANVEWSPEQARPSYVSTAAIASAARSAAPRFAMNARFLVIASAVFIVGIAGFIGWTLFISSPDIVFTLDVPEDVTAGDIATVTIRVANQGSDEVVDGALTLTFPAGTIVAESEASGSILNPLYRIPVPTIAEGGEFVKMVRVRFFGARGDKRSVAGTLVYRPTNIETKLTRDVEDTATITELPYTITIDAPEEVSSGQKVTVTIGVDSSTPLDLTDLVLGVDFPAGFTLTVADPAPMDTEKRLWTLGAVTAGATRQIKLNGTLRGEPKSVAPFRVRVGRVTPDGTWFLLAEESRGPTIATPFLFARVLLNDQPSGAIVPGTTVRGVLTYQNNLPAAVENVTIRVAFPEQYVDVSSVRIEKGFYDVTTKAITWNPSSNTNLANISAGTQSDLQFSFQLKKSLPIKTVSDQNLTFPMIVAINTATPPAGFPGTSFEYRDTPVFKISSVLVLAARAGYYDSPVANSGPLPPRARVPTTYTISLSLSSGASDIKNVVLSGTLGSNVAWKGPLAASVGSVSHNAANQKVSWSLPLLRAASGIIRPIATASFQVTLTPADNDVGGAPVLFKDISVNGEDSFTTLPLSDSGGTLTIEIKTDKRTTSSDWRVVP